MCGEVTHGVPSCLLRCFSSVSRFKMVKKVISRGLLNLLAFLDRDLGELVPHLTKMFENRPEDALSTLVKLVRC